MRTNWYTILNLWETPGPQQNPGDISLWGNNGGNLIVGSIRSVTCCAMYVFTLTLDINLYHLSITGSSGPLQKYSSGAPEHKGSNLKPVSQPNTQENAYTTTRRNR